jgi:ABC-type glycerol-3-phosphate transport system permease component
MVPLVWMLSTSLKEAGREFETPIRWLPSPIVLSNYASVIADTYFMRFTQNSVIITVLSTLGSLLSSSLVAYGFARLRFRGRDFWFLVLVSTMLLPGIVTLIPRFILFRELGWYNSWLPLIVPDWFASAFYVFLIRQYYLTLPYELDEAARVDGAGTFHIYTRIMLPLSGPVLASVVIFSFVSNWNEFLGPLIYTQQKDLWPLALGLRSFLQEYDTRWNLLMAGSSLMLLPVLIVFFSAQKYFIRGIALTGLTGR